MSNLEWILEVLEEMKACGYVVDAAERNVPIVEPYIVAPLHSASLNRSIKQTSNQTKF